MNPLNVLTHFTGHPHRQGVSYFEHLGFATGIAWRLLASAAAFALHALLPFISIAPQHDLEATAAYLAERNRWIETAHSRAPGAGVDARADVLIAG